MPATEFKSMLSIILTIYFTFYNTYYGKYRALLYFS